jgi:hypothetical protein
MTLCSLGGFGFAMRMALVFENSLGSAVLINKEITPQHHADATG